MLKLPRGSSARKRPLHLRPGFLRDSRVSLKTLVRYERALLELAEFHCLSLQQLASMPLRDVDAALESFLEKIFLSGRDRASAAYFVAAVRHLRVLRGAAAAFMLPRATASVAGWRRLQPDVTKDPLPWPVACWIAQYLSQQGSAADMQAARGLILQFDAYLRPCELIDLTVEAVFLSNGQSSKTYSVSGIIVAPSSQIAPHLGKKTTKTGDQDDTILFDSASRDGVQLVLRRLVEDARKRKVRRLLHLLSYDAYRRALARAARALALPFCVTPHLARHGGPSEDFARGARDLKSIALRGRWRALSSVRRYQKSGRLQSAWRKLSTVQQASASQAAAVSLKFITVK